VGAEGAHSKVRNFLLGQEKAALILSPIVASAVITSLPAEVALSFRKLHSRYCVMFHPNGYFCWLGGEFFMLWYFLNSSSAIILNRSS